MGFVGALEIALELQIVRRICEHQIDRTCGKLRHLGDAIANDDTGTRLGLKFSAGRPCRRPATRHNHDSITLTQATLSATRDDRKSTRLNSSHTVISYAVFCLKKKADY